MYFSQGIVNDEELANAQQTSTMPIPNAILKRENFIRQSSTVISHPEKPNVMKTSASMASISSDGTQLSMSYNGSSGNEIAVAPKYSQ